MNLRWDKQNHNYRIKFGCCNCSPECWGICFPGLCGSARLCWGPIFPLTLACVSSQYFKLIINTFYAFLCFVLHLYEQRLLFFVKIASFPLHASELRLDHGEGFYAGSCPASAAAGFVPQRTALWQLNQELLNAGEGSDDENAFCLALEAWLCPRFLPMSTMLSFLGILNVTYRFRNILCSILFDCTGLSS